MATSELSSYLLGKSLGILCGCLGSPDLAKNGVEQAQEANRLCDRLGLDARFSFPTEADRQSDYFRATFDRKDAYINQVRNSLGRNVGERAVAAFEIGFLLAQQWNAASGFSQHWQETLRDHFGTLKVPVATIRMVLYSDGQETFLEALDRVESFLAEPQTVFLSYRRDGGAPFARMLYIHLTYSGYDVFLDVETLGAVRFGPEIFSAIDQSYFFMPILTPGSIDRCGQDQDWLRQEIGHALKQRKKIVPIFCEGFSCPEETALHESIREIRQYNGCYLSHTDFRGFADKLENMLR